MCLLTPRPPSKEEFDTLKQEVNKLSNNLNACLELNTIKNKTNENNIAKLSKSVEDIFNRLKDTNIESKKVETKFNKNIRDLMEEIMALGKKNEWDIFRQQVGWFHTIGILNKKEEELATSIKVINKKMEEKEEKIEEKEEKIEELETAITELNRKLEKIAELETTITEIKSNITEIKSNITEIKSNKPGKGKGAEKWRPRNSSKS